MAAQDRRAARTQEILAATRALFDERGVRDAQIEDIARAVGINRAIIYRHFSGKEELFALTLVAYLDELAEQLRAADASAETEPDRLVAITRGFLEFGEQYPAFVDCAQSLLRRRGDELMTEVSDKAMFRLGQAMNGPLGVVVKVLDDGNRSGVFRVEDPALMANIFYTQALGVLNLATLRLAVREQNPGLPAVDDVPFETVKDIVVSSALNMALASAPR